MSTIRSEAKKMTTNRLQYCIRVYAEELERRVQEAEVELAHWRQGSRCVLYTASQRLTRS